MRRWMWVLAAMVSTSPALAGDDVYEQTYEVTQGAWLEIDCPTGRVLVDTWEQSKVELIAYHAPEAEVRSRQVRGDVQAGTAGEKNNKQRIEYEIRVPAWMNVDITGNDAEIDIRGVLGEIQVETIAGDVDVTGGRESTVLHSVKGDVRLEGARGEIDLESTNGEVTLVDCEGAVVVSAVNGDVRCSNVTSSMFEAETLNGDILFDGRLTDDGDYYFTTHVGDIELNIPRDVNLTVTAVSYHGDFSSDFDRQPQLERRGFEQRRWTLTLGKGTGRLRAESFQGDIEVFSSKSGRDKRGR